MKRFALIAAVVFTTTFTLQSCRQADEMILSPEEAATLQRVQDSSANSLNKNSIIILNEGQTNTETSNLDGEIAPPPRR